MASQDKEQVPWRDGKSKTWDFDKTKVRIYVDKTRWQNKYQHGPRLTQRAGAWAKRRKKSYQKLRRAVARVQGVTEPEVMTRKSRIKELTERDHKKGL